MSCCMVTSSHGQPLFLGWGRDSAVELECYDFWFLVQFRDGRNLIHVFDLEEVAYVKGNIEHLQHGIFNLVSGHDRSLSGV